MNKYACLIKECNEKGVMAIILMGSHARGDAGKFSDVDLLRIVESGNQKHFSGTRLINDHFVVVSNQTQGALNGIFESPDQATLFIKGLQTGKALYDPDKVFETLRQRAEAFKWTPQLQEKADQWVLEEMIGWIEEAQKGLEGLKRNDEGRLLNAIHGLSWGLVNVLRVHKGILITSDNTTVSEVCDAMVEHPDWIKLCRDAFGLIENRSLQQRVTSGLKLYVMTVSILNEEVQKNTLIVEIVKRINEGL